MSYEKLMQSIYRDESMRVRLFWYPLFTWKYERMFLGDIGLQPSMWALPAEATVGSVLDTVDWVNNNEKKISSENLKHLRRYAFYSSEINKYVPAIGFTGLGRRSHSKHPGLDFSDTSVFLDDGNHRTLGVALKGNRYINVLLGTIGQDRPAVDPRSFWEKTLPELANDSSNKLLSIPKFFKFK